MNHQELLADLLDRFQSSGESPMYVGYAETQAWPPGFEQALETSGLLVPATPTKTLVCDGCEEQCLMPVNTVPGDRPRAYIICESRDDVSRIPVALESLTRWKLTSSGLNKLLSESLGGQQGQASLAEGALPRLALSDLITIVNDEMRIDSESLFSALQPAETLDKPNCFKRTGDGWSITYLNKTQFFRDALGLKSIAYLIANQGKEIPAVELQRHIHPNIEPGPYDVSYMLDSGEVDSMRLSIGGLGDAGDTLDHEAITSINTRISKLEDNIEIAQDAEDKEEEAKALEELAKLQSYLSSQLNFRGRPRKEVDSHKRMVDALSKNIRKTRSLIRKSWPELADHFDCIKTGASFLYSPNPRIEWN